MKLNNSVFISFLIVLIFKKSGGVLECSKTEDCGAKEAVCTESLCQCPFGTTFSTDGSECLPYATEFNGECKDDTQCAWLLGKYECSKGFCVCAQGWRWFKGMCIEAKGLNETCTKDVDCYNGYNILAMHCQKNICVCKDGYYLRGNYDCRPISKEIDEACALNSDCQFEGGICENRRCVVNKLLNIKVEDMVFKSNPHKRSTFLGNNCVGDAECKIDDANSVCSPLTKKCICKRGYFFSEIEDACAAELGVHFSCNSDGDCPIRPSNCIGGACYCDKFRYSDKGNRKCAQAMQQADEKCITNESCYTLGLNSVCNSEKQCICTPGSSLDKNFVCVLNDDGCNDKDFCMDNLDCKKLNTICKQNKCVCKENHREEDKACWPNLGAECTDSCNIDHSVCDATCRCEENYVGNGTHICLPVANKLGDECSINDQCSKVIQHSVCMNNTCVCDDNYVQRNETCYEEKYIGAYCTAAFQCNIVMNNASCRNSKCQCSEGMVPKSDGRGCVCGNSSSMLEPSLYIFFLVLSFANVLFSVFP